MEINLCESLYRSKGIRLVSPLALLLRTQFRFLPSLSSFSASICCSWADVGRPATVRIKSQLTATQRAERNARKRNTLITCKVNYFA